MGLRFTIYSGFFLALCEVNESSVGEAIHVCELYWKSI